MAYADTLLTDGEQIILRTRQHWLALFLRSRAGIALFGLALLIIVSIVFFNVQPGVGRDVLSAIGMIVLVLAVLVFLYRLWQWISQEFIITNRRLVRVSGILNKRSSDSSLEKINDAILTQPVLGRMLNYGDLEILTAADQANDLYRMLRDPKGFKKTMLTQKHRLETEYSYVGAPPPSPPLRSPGAEYAAAPAAAPAAEYAAAPAPSPAVEYAPPPAPPPAAEYAPPPAPAAPLGAAPAAAVATESMLPTPATPGAAAQPPDPTLEVTQTLARLADLRDSGAITPEEYEQKKDQLLSRL